MARRPRELPAPDHGYGLVRAPGTAWTRPGDQRHHEGLHDQFDEEGRLRTDDDTIIIDMDPVDTTEFDTDGIIDAEIGEDETPTTKMPPLKDPARSREQDWAARLRRDTVRAEHDYVRSLRGIDLKHQRSESLRRSRENDLKGKHKAYASMMVLSCLVPLRNGVNVKSVGQLVGMSTTMWMLSPAFRKQCGSFSRDALAAIDEAHGRHQQRKRNRQHDRIDRWRDRNPDSELPPRLARRLRRIETMDRDGRVPFTERSAALTHMALTESAFYQMRQPGADSEQIRKGYDELMKSFWKDVSVDGLSVDAVHGVERDLIGQRMLFEPQFASVFNETAFGQVHQRTTDVIDAETGALGREWDGEWVTGDGQTVNGGTFTLRDPVKEDDLNSQAQVEMSISQTIYRDMERACTEGDLRGLNGVILGYGAAWGARNLDLSNAGGPTADPLRSGQRIMRSMQVDGLSDDSRKLIYADGFVRAMDNVGKTFPEVEAMWAAQYGESWREQMRELARDPQSVFNSWQEQGGMSQAPQPETPFPTGHSEKDPLAGDRNRRRARTYQRARTNQGYNEQDTDRMFGLGPDDFDQGNPDFEMG